MRKFILGVGAQKAGTSWLHAQVSRHPDFRPSQAKELHVLDAIYPGDQLPFRAKLVGSGKNVGIMPLQVAPLKAFHREQQLLP